MNLIARSADETSALLFDILIFFLRAFYVPGRYPEFFFENAGEIAIAFIPKAVTNLMKRIGRASDHILCDQHFAVVDIFRNGHIRFFFKDVCDVFLG